MQDIDFDGIADVQGDLRNFDQKLRTGHIQPEDSSDEDTAPVNRNDPVAVLEEKNQILMDRLYKSEKELNEMKETYQAITSDSESMKDKKIIDLAKKNRALQLQGESLKTKASKAAEFALALKAQQDEAEANKTDRQRNAELSATSSPGGTMSLDQERKHKDMEKRITKLRNENQEQKILIDKATRLLEREIGEVVDIHELNKEESAWKGRAQKVEILKAQVKKYKAQLGIGFNAESSMMTDGGLSVISEASVFTGKITHAERNISKIGDKKRDDHDKLKFQVEELKEELTEVKTKYKAALARRDTLEKQLKTIKTEFGMKIKMLLDKAENDDKLVAVLKQEVARLENVKGVKSQLKSVISVDRQNMTDLQKLKRDLTNTQNQVKCQEIEIEQKEAKIAALMSNCVGAPDERVEEKELAVAELQDKCEQLERDLFKAKQELQQYGDKKFPKRSKDESERMVQDLTKSNAMLRRKLDDALQKVTKFENTK